MLEHSFCLVQGIGPTIERRLWDRGVTTWRDVLDHEDVPLGPATLAKLRWELGGAAAALDRRDARFFAARLPPTEQWRLFAPFRDRTAYVDIETTGLSAGADFITTIALYDGREVRSYVHGQNLEAFADDILQFDLIVTFNGKSFDLPFIRKYLRIPLDHAHIDLMHVLRRLGMRGGLKKIEHRLGLARGDLEDVDGFFAVLLWHDYEHNDNPRALETLQAYNALDVINLATLMALAWNMRVEQTPFGHSRRLDVPAPIEPPWRPDPATIARLRGQGVAGAPW